jgi:HEAT repeat protein
LGFYDLDKQQRQALIHEMEQQILADIASQSMDHVLPYASDSDTYIRKTTYQILSRLYKREPHHQQCIRQIVENLIADKNEKARQTAVYFLGEIGEVDERLLERALHDPHHTVRNGVIGTLKILGKKHPQSTLAFARKHLHDEDAEIRRQIIHGIELHGRTHPEDILPLLREVQDNSNGRVRDMIVHVISQISYKEGCLPIVVAELKTWHNQALVQKALDEIIKLHGEQDYCVFSQEEAREYIKGEMDYGR